MTEADIESLPLQDYSKLPKGRVITIVEGERSGLRLIDFKDRVDMLRFREIDRGLPSEFEDTCLSDEETIREIRLSRPRRKMGREQEWYFGITVAEGVEENEVGELQGWVSIYQDERALELVKKSILPSGTPKESVFEVSYAKYQGAARGAISSGLRQVCLRFSQINAAVHQKEDEKVLSPSFFITSYVKSSNEASIRVLKAAGFEDKGALATKDGKIEYRVYVLDWDKLHQKLKEKQRLQEKLA